MTDGLSPAKLAILRTLDASTPRSAVELSLQNVGSPALDLDRLVNALLTLADRGYLQATGPPRLEDWNTRYVLTPKGEAIVSADT